MKNLPKKIHHFSMLSVVCIALVLCQQRMIADSTMANSSGSEEIFEGEQEHNPLMMFGGEMEHNHYE